MARPVRLDRLEDGYLRLVSTRQEPRELLPHGNERRRRRHHLEPAAEDRQEGSARARRSAALKHAYGSRLVPFRQGGRIVAYRLGLLIFTVEGGKRVGVVGLGRGTAGDLRRAQCDGVSLGRPGPRRRVIRPARRRSSASFASASGKTSTSVRTGTRGASARNSSAVRPRQVGDRAHLRSPQSSSYGKDGMSLMWMPAQTTVAALRERARAPPGRARRPGRTGSRRRAPRAGAGRSRPPTRRRARARTPAPRASSARREREHAPALVPRDLRDDVRRGAEAVEPEPLGVAGHAQRAVADQPGAQERRRLLVRVAVGDREAEALVGDRELRVAAVEVVAGEPRAVAEVLAARSGSSGTRRVQPSQGTAQAARRPRSTADDLVAGDERQLRVRELAVDDVQVGAAHAARATSSST